MNEDQVGKPEPVAREATTSRYVHPSQREPVPMVKWLDGWRPNAVTGEHELVAERYDTTRPMGHDPFDKCGDPSCTYCYRSGHARAP